MSRATLKRSLGEGGAFIGDSHGEDNLLAVLTAMANAGGEPLSARQATIATAVIAAMLVDVPSRIGTFAIKVGTTGTAGSTTVVVKVDTVTVATLTIANTETDGTYKAVEVNTNVDAESLIEIEVTAAPTAGANLTATMRNKPVTVET